MRCSCLHLLISKAQDKGREGGDITSMWCICPMSTRAQHEAVGAPAIISFIAFSLPNKAAKIDVVTVLTAASLLQSLLLALYSKHIPNTDAPVLELGLVL